MRDTYGREINYLRLSLTDRCNLRCKYCMPHGITPASHGEILTYEELLRIAGCAVSLGITRFKVTGGEPLVRRGCVSFVERLKAVPGVEQVTMTTNGTLLPDHLPALRAAGLDGINVSIDALDPAVFTAITGVSVSMPDWGALLSQCVDSGIHTKVNVVLQGDNRGEWLSLAGLAAALPVDVRFIERMPLGSREPAAPVRAGELLEALFCRWPDLHPVQEQRGNGPARYFASAQLRGRLGVIDAVSHRFCDSCNRLRLTSTGWLKPCLCYEQGEDLRAILRSGGTDAALKQALTRAIAAKPPAHCFESGDAVTERRAMSQIGG